MNEEWIFLKNKDFKGFDITIINNISLDEMKKIAFSNSNCVCFNTNGFFKYNFDINNIEDLNSNNNNNNENGIYIKKDFYDSDWIFFKNKDFSNFVLTKIDNSSLEEMKKNSFKLL